MQPEIMVPLVGSAEKYAGGGGALMRIAEMIFREHGVQLECLVGTMISCRSTNDTDIDYLRLSRDDACSFSTSYIERGILSVDLFKRSTARVRTFI